MTSKKEIGWSLDHSYARLPKSFFSSLSLNPVRSPKLIILNEQVAATLGLNVQELQSEEGLAIFAGNDVPEGAQPIAQAYAGHQFGHFTMLGDGRALLIGEQHTPQGELVDIQLKGSGRTTYSRGGDGRAALGPMLREYIISEAMHALNIPTTRSLAVVTTGEPVIRETDLAGAILTRIAASHIRVGTFQYVRNGCTVEELKILADYTLDRHFPDVSADENRYVALLQEVIERQASLIAKWQLVGFIHGVMNTDNTTISGETIDYGPCAFMDHYDEATVFSSIDTQGRYAFGNQPMIGGWNLARFAESLLPLLHVKEKQAIDIAQEKISAYNDLFYSHWLSGMRAKLGLFNEEEKDEILIKDLLKMMQENRADYTNTFRALTFDTLQDTVMFKTGEFVTWYERWQARLERQLESSAASKQLMKGNNPAIIPRNHRVEDALDAAVERGDYSVMQRLLHVLSNPYDHTSEQIEYSTPPDPSVKPYRTFCGT
ncbi:protein adenylyltransferase SelO [Cytobacillus sp. IB215316]|uniref:protein adenylyltransferase SelO n=1 Tax=Cytobacillus sp. IB215316 TaxID=3097354 RepID=UPI002A0DEA01|nr:YdiU family protein [Cytobacillus sp. IB215316]MDX8361442.1 YdiU family protein [Cytobacillus sp. IB215316]